MTHARRIALAPCLLLALLIPAAALAQDAAAQEITVPYTTDYLALGLVVVALILVVWTVRLAVRFRTLRKDADTLASLAGDSDTLS